MIKFITLLLLSSSLYAGRIGWEYGLTKYKADGTYWYRKSVHYTMEGCEATRFLYYKDNPLYKCNKFR